MTLIPESNSSNEISKLKRTFTLPRNPLIRMSRRRKPQQPPDEEFNEADAKNKKVLRRPSIKKLLNTIAQRIGGVPVIENNRVPPVGGLQTWGPDDTPGVTGIKNHGNTCFINAVLQCISHTDVLAEYFVLDKYKIDLARRNKLNSKKFGTKGEVTEQLAVLLKSLWACQYSADLSTNFKQVVERHGTQYKGNQQHDALEFLQWLLDKVHEDLNTASKKKYKSIKTSGRPDEVIAAETLENYKRCNNSFVQGIFQAQYRSSLSCSRCRTQSNTFDPFQCISVQLPQFSKQSIYVTVLYTNQQPRQVQIGLSMPSGATISELRHILESDTSIERNNMLITEIGEGGFLRTFTDVQNVNIISEIDPIYCIEVAQLKDLNIDGDIIDEDETTTSAYILLCWINVLVDGTTVKKFGSPYTMQVSRETSYNDLQKLILKEMAPILHDDVLTASQAGGIFKIRISDPACNDNEPPCYLEPELEHPLFMEAIDQALALCSEGGPQHVKLIMEFTPDVKSDLIADDTDVIEEHFSVKQLRAQALQGGAPLTLEECFRDYTEAETLSDAWRCPHCQQYQPVVKTLDMWSLPDILVVHFKRFRQQTLRGCSSAKLTTMVDFPIYNLDMSPHLAIKSTNNSGELISPPASLNNQQTNNWSPFNNSNTTTNNNNKQRLRMKHANHNHNHHLYNSNSENVYDLYGICYHHGSDIETGHYTAACKNPYDSQWYLYDDAKVTNLSKQTDDIGSLLVNNSAYILFYQRRLYMGSSTSSAASTSSVGSSTNATSDGHWVTKMPKFQPPKCAKLAAEKKNNVGEEKSDINKKDVDETQKIEEVELKNVQNMVVDNDDGPLMVETELIDHEERKPLHTTSIYINANGEFDIVSKNGDADDNVNNKLNSENEKKKVYTTTASVHRHSANDNISRTRFNWMSPQPARKLNQSQQSV